MELHAGTIIKSHGIKGDLVVEVTTDYPEERFAVGSTITLEQTSGTTSEHEVVAARWHQDRLLVRLSGIADRTAADEVRNAHIVVSEDSLSELVNEEDDEYHISVLLELTAVTTEGAELGKVTDLLSHTAQDILVITDAEGAEHMVPFVKALVPDIDLENKKLVCDLPEGLWELL
ncbi:MAG TPA: ribosome maturation factor RimM [Corynebacteriales bacterium]|nr:ribosome maturation factor RimM [Mycobacteriales bacterium]